MKYDEVCRTKYDIGFRSTKYDNAGYKYENGLQSTKLILEVRLNVGSTRNGIHFINVTHYRSLFMFFVFGSAFASLILSALCLRSGSVKLSIPQDVVYNFAKYV